MSKFTQKNLNRRHFHAAGGDKAIAARRERRILGGKFGHADANYPSLFKAVDLGVGTGRGENAPKKEDGVA